MNICMADPTFEQITSLRDRYQILDDWRRTDEESARKLHEQTIYSAIEADGETIGYVWFEGYSERAPQLGCIFGACVEQEWRGKWTDQALPALLDLLDFAFEDLDVPRISFEFDRRRSNIERWGKKLGFEFEGKRPNGLVINGRRRDLTILGMTAEGFKEFRDASVADSSD
jgi:RimJ/RimL family protein N-acetyltransferase